MKADSLPQIFHTFVLHHKVGFDQGGPGSSHTNDLAVGPFPNVFDQVENRHQRKKVALENTIKTCIW